MHHKTKTTLEVCGDILKEIATDKYSRLDEYLILRSMATFLEVISKEFVPIAIREFENERGN